MRGLISSVELPDITTMFYEIALKHGATPSTLKNGVFLAEKGEIALKLTIGPRHQSIPSKMLGEILEEVMNQTM